MTIDCSARRSPRCTATIVPAAGAVSRTPGALRSSQTGVPRSTRSPAFTSTDGFMPA